MPDDLQSDIQATADDIAADSEALHGIETQKAALDADDPRLVELSEAARALGRAIASKTVAQHELVLEATEPDRPAAEPAG